MDAAIIVTESGFRENTAASPRRHATHKSSTVSLPQAEMPKRAQSPGDAGSSKEVKTEGAPTSAGSEADDGVTWKVLPRAFYSLR